MKKALILTLSLAMVATLVLTGCNKSQKAMKEIGDKVCADNGKNANSIVLNDAFAEFAGRIMFVAMKDLLGDDMTEEKFLEQGKEKFKKEADEKMEFETCSTEVETKSCEDIFKEIAESDKMKDMGDDVAKTVAEVGEKMGIKNCGVLTIKAKEKNDDKDKTGKMYVGEIEGEYKVFFAEEPE